MPSFPLLRCIPDSLGKEGGRAVSSPGRERGGRRRRRRRRRRGALKRGKKKVKDTKSSFLSPSLPPSSTKARSEPGMSLSTRGKEEEEEGLLAYAVSLPPLKKEGEGGLGWQQPSSPFRSTGHHPLPLPPPPSPFPFPSAWTDGHMLLVL